MPRTPTGVIEGHEEAGEDKTTSSVPNLMILFNPVLDTTDKGYGAKKFKPDQQMELSICHHVRSGIVPTLVMHGTNDTTVPFENADRFARLMTASDQLRPPSSALVDFHPKRASRKQNSLV